MPAAFQSYSPTAAQPYQAEAAPEVAPAAPSPIPAQPNQANGAVGTAGAIATVADGILRGFMQGRAQRAAQQVMKQQKLGTDLNNSYNADAQRLYQLHQAGVDEKAPAYQQAKSAVDGSWEALQQFRGQAIQQQGKKGKGKKQDQQLPPEAVLHNPASSPQEKSEALFALSQRFGPPVYGQIAVSKSQQQQQAATPQYQASQLQAQNTLTREKDVARRNELMSKPEADRSKAENDELALVNERMTPSPKPVAEKPGDEVKKAADEVFKRLEDPKYAVTDRDKMILAAAKYPVGGDSKISVTSRGEIISEAKDGSSYKVLRGPQAAYEPRGEGGGAGKPKRGTPEEFSLVEKDTSTAYAKAKDGYTKSIQGIDDAAAKTPDAWPKDRITKEKKQAGDDLMAENKRIADLNSARTRDLGGIPAEGAQHPAAAAHKPEESTHGQPVDTSRFMVTPNPKGLVEPGNLSIWDRPTVHNADGSHSSEYSTSFQDDKGHEVLVPTVVNGKFLTPDGKKPKEGSAEEKTMFKKAWQHYLDTGENLGKFDNPKDADAYASTLHNRGEKRQPAQPKGIVRKQAFLDANPGATEADWDSMKPSLKAQGYEPKD